MAFAKQGLKEALLDLENTSLAEASAALREHFQAARLDLNEARDDEDQSHQREAADLAQGLDPLVHEREAQRRVVEGTSFEPKQRVEPGAVVKVEGRHIVIAVATPSFTFQGMRLVGVSPDAPLVRAMAGLRAGDAFLFRGRELRVEEVR